MKVDDYLMSENSVEGKRRGEIKEAGQSVQP